LIYQISDKKYNSIILQRIGDCPTKCMQVLLFIKLLCNINIRQSWAKENATNCGIRHNKKLLKMVSTLTTKSTIFAQ